MEVISCSEVRQTVGIADGHSTPFLKLDTLVFELKTQTSRDIGMFGIIVRLKKFVIQMHYMFPTMKCTNYIHNFFLYEKKII